jgi:hypothetical protein
MKIGTRGGNWVDMTIYRGGTTTPTINFYDTDNNLYYSVTEKHRPEKLLLIYNGPRIVYVYAKKDTPLYKNFQS